jgi:hypothetical protein
MIKFFLVMALLASGIGSRSLADVLIVADEMPVMHSLVDRLKSEEHIESKVISQDELPASLGSFNAVIVYIHKALSSKAEEAFVAYTKGGGKLVVLHHSISSGKRKNEHWFPFLGVSLPEGDVDQGGYKWTEGVTWDLVNLNPNHFIMTNRMIYPQQIAYTSTNAASASHPPAQSQLTREESALIMEAERQRLRQAGDPQVRLMPMTHLAVLPGFTLSNSEVYVNHVHTEPRTLLMGLKYTDKGGTTYMQDRAGWVKPAGKGWIVYLMPGHRQSDFDNVAYGRIVLNAIIWKP